MYNYFCWFYFCFEKKYTFNSENEQWDDNVVKCMLQDEKY